MTDLPRKIRRREGTFSCTLSAEIPATSFGGAYRLRYGLYKPERGGGRVVPRGDTEGSRVRGGRLIVDIDDGAIEAGRYEAETPPDPAGDINREGKILDFVAISTNGALRLDHPAAEDWMLTPLPGSLAFEAALDPEALDEDRQPIAVEAVDPYSDNPADPVIRMKGRVLRLALQGEAFAYRIRFE